VTSPGRLDDVIMTCENSNANINRLFSKKERIIRILCYFARLSSAICRHIDLEMAPHNLSVGRWRQCLKGRHFRSGPWQTKYPAARCNQLHGNHRSWCTKTRWTCWWPIACLLASRSHGHRKQLPSDWRSFSTCNFILSSDHIFSVSSRK